MAVYGNFVSYDKLSNLNYIMEEGNNIVKVLESINVLNESNILLHEDFKDIIKEKFQKFVEWLKKVKDAFVKAIKELKERISNKIKDLLQRNPKVKTVTFADIDTEGIDFYDYKQIYSELDNLYEDVEKIATSFTKTVDCDCEDFIDKCHDIFSEIKEYTIGTETFKGKINKPSDSESVSDYIINTLNSCDKYITDDIRNINSLIQLNKAQSSVYETYLENQKGVEVCTNLIKVETCLVNAYTRLQESISYALKKLTIEVSRKEQ